MSVEGKSEEVETRTDGLLGGPSGQEDRQVTSTARRTETWEHRVEISTAHATLSTYTGSVGSQITTVKCLQLAVQG